MANNMKTQTIREKFLDYFKEHGHEPVPSASLLPTNDPSLLFTNAGMVPFKDVFLGTESRPYTRACSIQRCIRAGGKHNDLENVGYTARHHTFFEMLGNFSFGDYFKKEAIEFAWHFLTQVLQLPEEKLWVTVYKEDQETADLWLKTMKVSPDRFSYCGEKDNFWSMGDVGPCGPCTEIFYDHGDAIPGGPPGSPEEDGDRYVEIWNLVFMQYNRQADGRLLDLPKPSVDTGMGLERIAAVVQGVHSNYEIDLFTHLRAAAGRLCGTTELMHPSLCVIVDHIRSASFLIMDGITPSNEGRGYVLRRIIRRALRHGHKLGAKESFFYLLVSALVKQMGEAYPDLVSAQSLIEQVVQREEEQFAETLGHGLRILEQRIAEMTGQVIPGDLVFQLYDTYGFPKDLTADIARERGLQIDEAGFDAKMDAQRARSQQASQFTTKLPLHDIAGTTAFTGYDREHDTGTVIGLFAGDAAVEQLAVGESGVVALDQTPFYPDGGGQVGDVGVLVGKSGQFVVADTQKQGNVILHHGTVKEGQVRMGESLEATVDPQRSATKKNHTATHLLHAALRQLLGTHVTQKGSLVEPNRLRFDFSHPAPMTAAEIQAVEDWVNAQILENIDAVTDVLPMDEAKKRGAMALFSEKYDDEVRVLQIGGVSIELCGGTHVNRTGDIGLFKITSESGIAAGIRRLEAVTGLGALNWVRGIASQLDQLSATLKANHSDVQSKLEQLIAEQKTAEKQLQVLKKQLASGQGSNIMDERVSVGDLQLLTKKFDNVDAETLRSVVDDVKSKDDNMVVLVAGVVGDKVQLIAGVSASSAKKISAVDVLKHVAQQIEGKGGGRPDLAQGGGQNSPALDEALKALPAWLAEQLD